MAVPERCWVQDVGGRRWEDYPLVGGCPYSHAFYVSVTDYMLGWILTKRAYSVGDLLSRSALKLNEITQTRDTPGVVRSHTSYF